MAKGKEKPLVCSNIDYLRTAYGETIDDLADTLHCSRQAVSNYINSRIPNPELLQIIAQHYSITVEELSTVDLSYLSDNRLNIDFDAFWKYLPIILPVYKPTQPTDNEYFNNALDYHKNVFERFKSLRSSDYNSLDNAINDLIDHSDSIENCFMNYEKASEDESIKQTAASNTISFAFFIWILFSSIEIAYEQPAIFHQMKVHDPKLKKSLESIADDTAGKKECKDMMGEVCEHYDDSINKKLIILKNGAFWSDIASYYLALRYCIGFVDNDLEPAFNRRIGFEMMISLSKLGNRNATNYIKIIYNASGFVSTQNVDDK